MTQTQELIEPRMIERLCGGWLAVSSEAEPIKFGVTGQTREDALANYRFSLTRWRLLLTADRAALEHHDKGEKL